MRWLLHVWVGALFSVAPAHNLYCVPAPSYLCRFSSYMAVICASCFRSPALSMYLGTRMVMPNPGLVVDCVAVDAPRDRPGWRLPHRRLHEAGRSRGCGGGRSQLTDRGCIVAAARSRHQRRCREPALLGGSCSAARWHAAVTSARTALLWCCDGIGAAAAAAGISSVSSQHSSPSTRCGRATAIWRQVLRDLLRACFRFCKGCGFGPVTMALRQLALAV